MMQMSEDEQTESMGSFSPEKIGPLFFFCWMVTLCIYFVFDSLSKV